MSEECPVTITEHRIYDSEGRVKENYDVYSINTRWLAKESGKMLYLEEYKVSYTYVFVKRFFTALIGSVGALYFFGQPPFSFLLPIGCALFVSGVTTLIQYLINK